MAACEYSEKISAYHDGELDSTDRAMVEQHLAQCPACAAALSELRAMSKLFAEASAPRLSQISMHRLHARVDVAMDEGLMKIARVLSAIAASVLIVGSAWLVHSRDLANRGQPSPSGPSIATFTQPPWAGIPSTVDAEQTSSAVTIPAAQWYLADNGGRSDDLP